MAEDAGGVQHPSHPEENGRSRPSGEGNGRRAAPDPDDGGGGFEGWKERFLGPRRRRAPYLRVLAYYAAVTALGALLITTVPAVRQAFVAEIVLPAGSGAGELFTGGAEGVADGQPLGVSGIVDRSVTVALVVVGALLLVAPVTWVYMYTRRIQYDPSLVHSIIILPVVVAAVVVIVKNSLALAFSLAGIVAAVRFRTTIKDLKDAVYIFLAIGIGLAAGVQALDVALVVSMAFTLVILTLWKFDLARIYTGGPGRREILSIGDPDLLVARSADQRQELRDRLSGLDDGMKTDGILLVHAVDLDAARRAVEVSLHGRAKEWKFGPAEKGKGGCSTLPVLVRLKSNKGDPLKVLGEMEERFHRHIAAAEFIASGSRTDEE